MNIRQRTVHVNGIDIALRESGDVGAPLIVLAHGFPETSHSWRHQMQPLADAGYHVIAPDQRGYGYSTSPSQVDAYTTAHLASDLLEIALDAGHEKAIYVGHDWGSLLLWDLCRMHPERVIAGVAASVPFTDWPQAPLDIMRARYGDRFFYIIYFQELGTAEQEFDANVDDAMRRILWGASADCRHNPAFFSNKELPPALGTKYLDNLDTPPALPWSWLSDEEFQEYVKAFTHSGFFGPVSWYRNMNANYEVTKNIPASHISMPMCFITGEYDPVNRNYEAALQYMDSVLPQFRGGTMIPNAGHWVQQESPAAFNEALFTFLHSL